MNAAAGRVAPSASPRVDVRIDRAARMISSRENVRLAAASGLAAGDLTPTQRFGFGDRLAVAVALNEMSEACHVGTVEQVGPVLRGDGADLLEYPWRCIRYRPEWQEMTMARLTEAERARICDLYKQRRKTLNALKIDEARWPTIKYVARQVGRDPQLIRDTLICQKGD